MTVHKNPSNTTTLEFSTWRVKEVKMDSIDQTSWQVISFRYLAINRLDSSPIMIRL